MNFSFLGGRKNVAYYVTVLSVFVKAIVLHSLDVEVILTAGITFMASSAVIEASAQIVSARRRR